MATGDVVAVFAAFALEGATAVTANSVELLKIADGMWPEAHEYCWVGRVPGL